jgi:mannitol/fructose-specific phosphotransferase system IIA component (Ntr-type)
VKPKNASSPFRFDPNLFFGDLDASSREDLFAKLVAALAEQGIAQHRGALEKLLLEREALGTTAIGGGIAIPHARSMVVGAPAVAFARLRQGLPFGARDRVRVRAVFLLVAPHGPAGTLYQPLLAALAAASHDEAARSGLLEVETFDAFAKLMSRFVRPQFLEAHAP